MQHWDLTAANEGSRTGPQVLFSTPEARGVVVNPAQDEEMGDHQVRERALVQVLRGKHRVYGWNRHCNLRGARAGRLRTGRASYTARSAAHPPAPHASPVAGRALRRLGREATRTSFPCAQLSTR
jgi:hypothetical protein